MPAQIISTSHGQTMVLTLSNPEYRNALGPEMYAAGVEALNAADNNPDVRSVVITGEGAQFCAGGNLQRLLENRLQPPQVQTDSIEALHNWIETIRSFPKPVIAAVEGAAAGAGFSLCLACDLVVAARSAVFVMAYSNVGLSCDGGASWALTRSLPRQLAMELLMTGSKTSAERLHALGIVNEVTSDGQALAAALELAAKLNCRAPNAMASLKELVNESESSNLHQQLARERSHFVQNLHHLNAGEGISAFLAKRPAQYV